MAVPAWEMASSAYSTWYSRPSGEKMVVYGHAVSLYIESDGGCARPWSSGWTYSGIVTAGHGGGAISV